MVKYVFLSCIFFSLKQAEVGDVTANGNGHTSSKSNGQSRKKKFSVFKNLSADNDVRVLYYIIF